MMTSVPIKAVRLNFDEKWPNLTIEPHPQNLPPDSHTFSIPAALYSRYIAAQQELKEVETLICQKAMERTDSKAFTALLKMYLEQE